MGQQTVYDDFPHNAGISRWQWGSSLSLTVPRLRFFFPCSFSTKTKTASGVPLAALQRPESVAFKQTNDRRYDHETKHTR